MAVYCFVNLLIMSLVVISDIKGYNAEPDQISALIIMMQNISHSLDTLNNYTQESLRLQKENNGALRYLQSFKSIPDKDMDSRLQETQLQVHMLEGMLHQLNSTVKTSTDYTNETRLEAIKDLVLQFNSSRDWELLKSGLLAVMDEGDEVYSQLQTIRYSENEYMWKIGENNYTQLASVLLNAGLPADTVDKGHGTMMNGAASAGHLQLVKMLMEHGASVTGGGLGGTPLDRASAGGQLEMVKFLQHAGADVAARNVAPFIPSRLVTKEELMRIPDN